MSLQRPSNRDLRRQMARAQAEAASARFWLSCTRLLLGGVVAVMTGVLAGTMLWVFVGTGPGVPDLGPSLLTAGRGDHHLRIEPPVPDSATVRPIEPPSASLEEPPAVPVLVPDEGVQLSLTEQPSQEEQPFQEEEEGETLEVQEAPEGLQAPEQTAEAVVPLEPSEHVMEEPAAAVLTQEATAANLLRKPTPGDIDAALAGLDLDRLSPKGILPETPPAWRRNAVPVLKPFDRPVIAVIIDDLGLNRPNTRRTIDLPGPLTLALMTYADNPQPLADKARAAGHELLVHFPMAPRDPRYNPGPNVLRDDLGTEELARRLAWGLSRFEGYVGINNHMGSGFTTSIPGMAQVMMELKARGLLYLDSLTVPGTVGSALADRVGVPFAKRDVFIDNDPGNRQSIRRQLLRLERIALRTGRAVGIGHPHDTTLDELAEWLPKLKKRGFQLVPISALVLTPSGIAIKPRDAASPG